MVRQNTGCTPSIPVTFRTTPDQMAQMEAAIPAYRRKTGGNLTLSELIRQCVHGHLARMAGASK